MTETIAAVTGFLAATVRLSTPLLLASTGELVTERSGLLNLSVEAMMITGAFAGFTAAYFSNSIYVGWLVAMAAGGAAALLFAYLTVTLRANQIIVALGLNMLASGATGFAYRRIFGLAKAIPEIHAARALHIPWFNKLPILGPALFAQTSLVYVAIVLLAGVWYVLNRTPLGLTVRAVGENAIAADASGISVSTVRYGAAAFGGALAGLGGAYFSTVALNVFLEGMTAGAGWIAVAIVIFGNWNAKGILMAALIFGGAQALQLRLQVIGYAAPREFIIMLPYVLTLILLAGFVRRSNAPAQLAVPYGRAN